MAGKIVGALAVVGLVLGSWMFLHRSADPPVQRGVASPTGEIRQIPVACRDLLEEPPAPARPGGLVLADATVLTMDDARTRARGVVINEGLIEDVLEDEPSRTSSDEVALGGAVVLPGFIDSHSHWIGDRTLAGQTSAQAIRTALSQGWTSISELFVDEGRLSELCRLHANGHLRLKVGAFLPVNYEFQRFGHWYDAYSPGEELGPHLFVQGIKFFVDRAEDGLGFQTEPPDDSVQGQLFWDPGGFATELRRAHGRGWQIAVHATGDGGLDLVLDGFQSIGRRGIVAQRHRIEL